VYRVLAEKGLTPDFVAGHSLGEYSALVAAGSLKFADAVQLVHRRGTYMQDAVPAGGARCRDYGFVAGSRGGCLQARGGGRNLFGGKSEFAGPDGDFRARRCGKASRGIGLSGGSEARRDSGGFPRRFIRR